MRIEKVIENIGNYFNISQPTSYVYSKILCKYILIIYVNKKQIVIDIKENELDVPPHNYQVLMKKIYKQIKEELKLNTRTRKKRY